jgi:peptide/nickel transport system substrate-binding protein
VRTLGFAIFVAVTLVISLLFLVPANQARADNGSVLIVAQQSDPGILNNMLGDTLGSFYVNYNVYQELVHLSYNGTTVLPALAKSWTISPDNLNYTFHLRIGVTWQDGQPFTATDVAYTLNTAMTLPAWYISYLLPVAHVYVDDQYNVSVVLSSPDAGWLTLLAFGSDFGLNILPAHLYQGTNVSTNPHNQDPIGTGPYMFVSHIPGQSITLQAYPNYWGGAPSIQKVVIVIIPSSGTAVQELQAGTVQYLDTFDNPVDFSQVPPLQNVPNLVISHPTGGVITWVLFNTNATPFNNPTLRLAFAYGINRTELAAKAYFNYALPMNGFYIAGPWFDSSAQVPYDPAKAKSLLDSIGYTPAANGTRMTIQLAYHPLFGMDVEAQVIQAQLAQIGVNAQFWSADYPTWFTKVQVNGDYQMAIRASQIGPDPDLLWPWLDPQHVGESGATYFNNTTMNNLFTQAREITDFNQRQTYYNQIQEILAANVPVIPLTNIEDVNMWRSDQVQNVGPQLGTDRWDLSGAQLVGGGGSSSTIPLWEIAAIAAAVVLIAAAVVVVSYRRGKKAKAEAAADRAEQKQQMPPGSSPPPSGGTGGGLGPPS